MATTVQEFYLFLSVMVPIAFSPGPANLSLASHGVAFGMRRSLAFLSGLIGSSFIIVSLISLAFNRLISDFYDVLLPLKYLGAIYLLYLSYRLFAKAIGKKDGPDKSMSFIAGALLNALNGKFYMMVFVVLSQFMDSRFETAIKLVLWFVLVTIAGNLLWLQAGVYGRTLFHSERAIRIQSIFYSVTLFVTGCYLLVVAAD